MITLTWGNLRNGEFRASLGKLYAKPMGYSEGMRFALLGKEIKKQQALCEETHAGMLKKYGTPDPERTDVFSIPEANQAAYTTDMTKLDATTFTIKVSRFDALKLSESIEFSPQDLMLLEPILLPFEIPTDTTTGVADTTPKLVDVSPSH